MATDKKKLLRIQGTRTGLAVPIFPRYQAPAW